MPREKEAYRDNLEMLMQVFPGRLKVKATELSRYFGQDVRTIKRHYPISDDGTISLATLARCLS